MHGFESAISLVVDTLRIMRSETGYGIAVWFLAVIFAWSAISKLRRPASAAMAMVDFRVVRKLQPRLGSVLGAAEMLLALSLALGVAPEFFLPLAAGLLWLFVFLIARSLLSREQFACFCFGDTESKISRWTLIRTIILAAIASVQVIPPIPANLYTVSGQSYVLQAVSAITLVGVLVLGSWIPKLLRWNKDAHVIGTREVSE